MVESYLIRILIFETLNIITFKPCKLVICSRLQYTYPLQHRPASYKLGLPMLNPHKPFLHLAVAPAPFDNLFSFLFHMFLNTVQTPNRSTHNQLELENTETCILSKFEVIARKFWSYIGIRVLKLITYFTVISCKSSGTRALVIIGSIFCTYSTILAWA